MKKQKEIIDKHSWIEKHPVISLLSICTTLLLIFYYPIMFQGKVLISPDNSSSEAIGKALSPYTGNPIENVITALGGFLWLSALVIGVIIEIIKMHNRDIAE